MYVRPPDRLAARPPARPPCDAVPYLDWHLTNSLLSTAGRPTDRELSRLQYIGIALGPARARSPPKRRPAIASHVSTHVSLASLAENTMYLPAMLVSDLVRERQREREREREIRVGSG